MTHSIAWNSGKNAPRALVLDPDMMFGVRVERGLAKLGFVPRIVSSVEEAVEAAAVQRPVLLCISFGRRDIDANSAIRQLRILAPGLVTLGYGPHALLTDLRPAAVEAGCNLLVANSGAATKLPAIIDHLFKGAEAPG